MDSNSGLSAGDILALTKNNEYDGMMGGMGFWWVIIFFIIAGMFGGNGFGFGNNGAVTNDTLLGEEFIKRDIFNTNQNVSETSARTQQEVLSSSCQTQRDVLENRYTTQLGLQNLQAQNQACCCETQKEILQSRYDNSLGQCGIQRDIMQNRYDNLLGQSNLQKDLLLGNKDLQAQLAECCCDLKTAIHAEGEETRRQMQNDKIEELRASLNTVTQSYNNLALANNVVNQVRPYPQPAYITASPYQSFGCGCNTGCGYNYGVSSVI